jgi:hypothetical protein
MEKLEADYKAERISRREYAERKKQSETGSITSSRGIVFSHIRFIFLIEFNE